MSDKKIPIMRMNTQDINALLSISAAYSTIEAVGNQMEKRIRSIPNGWRDLKCVLSLTGKMVENLVMTIPPEKLPNLRRMLPKVRFKLVLGPQATNTEKDETLIGHDDLDVLVAAARERCKMCVDWSVGKCTRCEVGRVLDHVVSFDRNGKDWDMVTDEEVNGDAE